MNTELLVILYCILTGVAAAGFLKSASDLIFDNCYPKLSFLSPKYTPLHMLHSVTVGSLEYYKRAHAHCQIAMHEAPSEWVYAGLSFVVAVTWNFLIGVLIINVFHIVF